MLFLNLLNYYKLLLVRNQRDLFCWYKWYCSILPSMRWSLYACVIMRADLHLTLIYVYIVFIDRCIFICRIIVCHWFCRNPRLLFFAADRKEQSSPCALSCLAPISDVIMQAQLQCRDFPSCLLQSPKNASNEREGFTITCYWQSFL